MNGVHDMGGMHGFGPIHPEPNEPVFHSPSEGRMYAMSAAVWAWQGWNLDMFRAAIETLPPADYLSMSYYEKWLAALTKLMVEAELVTQDEVDSGRPSQDSVRATPPLVAADVEAYVSGAGSFRRDAIIEARFRAGYRVVARNINPESHTRLPRYVRGKQGVVVRDHGVFVFPDSNAMELGENPQHLYSVRFAARDLWGDQARPTDSVYLDLWDSYLDQA